MSAQLNTRRVIDTVATPDNENGTETRSNLIAYCFWKKIGRLIIRFKTRRSLREIYNMFISSSHFPEDLKETPRSFNQVLFSLCHDGKVCRVVKGKIQWKFNWKSCDTLTVLKEESCSGLELDDHVREIASMFLTENAHSLRWLRNYREIKFFYELWSSTHDDVVLICSTPDPRDVPTKVDPIMGRVHMLGIPRFGRILFALSADNECRVISRSGRAPIVHWGMNDKFYQKKSSHKSNEVSNVL